MSSEEEVQVVKVEPVTKEKKRPPIRIIMVSVLAILAIILVVQNREPVETKIFWATIEMPRAVLLLTTFLLGVIVGLLAAYIRKRQTSK